MARERRKPLRLPRWTLIAFGAVILLLFAYGTYRYVLRQKVARRLDEIRAAGYPATSAELDAAYEYPPPGENAADLYLEAYSLYVKDAELVSKIWIYSSSNLEAPANHEPPSVTAQQAIAAHVDDNAAMLTIVRDAAAMKQARYPVDLSVGLNSDMPHFRKLHACALIISLAVQLQTEQGELDHATRDVLAMLMIARSLKDEPILISHFVQLGIQDRAADALERALNRAQFDEQQLALMQQIFADLAVIPQIDHLIAAERCMTSDAFGGSTTEIATWLMMPTWKALAYRMTGVVEFDHLQYLDITDQYIAASKVAPEKRAAAMELVDMTRAYLPSYYVGTRNLTGFYSTTPKTYMRYASRWRLDLAALAIERYRLANGQLPNDLAELVPQYLDAVPLDPFDPSGQTIRYRKLQIGYLLYGVGVNAIDDGGVSEPPPATGSTIPPDIVLEIRR